MLREVGCKGISWLSDVFFDRLGVRSGLHAEDLLCIRSQTILQLRPGTRQEAGRRDDRPHGELHGTCMKSRLPAPALPRGIAQADGRMRPRTPPKPDSYRMGE